MSKKFIRKTHRGTIVTIFLCAVILIVARNAFYGNAVSEHNSIYINSDTDYNQVRNSVFFSVESPIKRKAFDIYAKRINLQKRIKAGYYKIEKGQSVIRIARALALGEQSPVNLVIGEARTLPQLAGKIASQIECDSLTLLRAMQNRELRASVGYVKDSLIALFLPNTYQVWWSVKPEQLLQRMKRESDTFWNSKRKEKARNAGFTPYQVMTLASIVYEETKEKSEMPKIAGVYINRLRKGMPLQACPTVKYAMGEFDLKRIMHKHLKYRSPFNTYVNKGLPPAPICIPSLAAIEAVLNYEKSDYLFFCAKPEFNGKHNFARTLKEHNKNAEAYAKALDKLSKK